MVTRRKVLKGLLGTALAGLSLGGYAGFVEPDLLLRVRHWALQPTLWPRGQKLRLVMVADLHAGVPNMSEARIAEVVATANAQGGDLILLMGDYRATHPFQLRTVPIEVTAAILAGLQAALGVYAVLGNHDWWDDLAAVRARKGPTHSQTVLEAAGIAVLANRAVKVADRFWLAGLESQTALQIARGQRKNWTGMADLAGTLAQVTDAAPVILMAHEPDIFAQGTDRVALTLSGHTHGGQVRFGPWTPVVPSQFGGRYAYGWIREDGRDLVVSGGLGCSGLPVRFGSPPEITVVDLS